MSRPNLSNVSDDFFPAVQKGFATNLSSSISDSDTTISLDSTTGFDDDDRVYLWIDRGESNEELVTGIVDGTNLTAAKRGIIGTAGAHSGGAEVEQLVSSADLESVIKGIKQEHNADGTHSDVTANSLTTDTISEETTDNGVDIDSLKIKDGKIDTADAVEQDAIANDSVGPDELIANLPIKAIAVGQSSSFTQGSGNETTSVSFPAGRFSTTPIVIGTPQRNTTNGHVTIKVIDKDTDGATFLTRNVSDDGSWSGMTINWIAIELA